MASRVMNTQLAPALTARLRLLLIYTGILVPFVVYGASQALQSNNNSPLDWVGHSFAPRMKYDAFVEQFGPGDVVVLSWKGCTWKNPVLDELLAQLRSESALHNADPKPWIYSVLSGRETLLQMTRGGTGRSSSVSGVIDSDSDAIDSPSSQRAIPADVAVQRMQGFLIGPDGLTTCLIVTVTKEGLRHRAELVAELKTICTSITGQAESELKLAGPVIDGLTVDEASQKSLATFAAPSSLMIMLLCWLSLRSFRAALIVFGCATFCQGATLAVIYYTGETLSALLIILPPLIQVLAVAGGIHLSNYYFESLASETHPSSPAIAAIQKGWLPCVLSALTTAMGSASLIVSELTPIRQFGIYATIGVILTAAVVLTLVPGLLLLFPVKRTSSLNTASARLETAHDQTKQHTDAWRFLAGLLQRTRLPLVILILFMIICACGLPRVKTSIRVETLFPGDSRILQDYRWLEDHIGPLVPIEILVTFQKDCRLHDRQRMELLYEIDRSLSKRPSLSRTTSALAFFPPIPEESNLPRVMRINALNRAIALSKAGFQQADMLRVDENGEYWRMTARTSALHPVDYGQLLREVDQASQEFLIQNADKYSSVSVSTSGIMPLVHEIQGRLLKDLFSSLLSALAVITLTMTIVEAGIINGLVAMVSNVFPIVVAFGMMGWLNQPLDIGSVMTASVALGVAVDDTLHFLTFFRRGSAQGYDRKHATLYALQHCGAAMIQTSVSCGLGLFIFSFSDFVPTSRFAILMVTLLLLALVGDLLLLPAILIARREQKT
ncbi:MAG: MMPL family transporter [Planctomycetaceae bacterium]|nr:MMPL family transporter [Planctomycetaceae bacterium]